MKQQESAKFDLNDLDIKVEPECSKIVIVRKMDFENKEAMPAKWFIFLNNQEVSMKAKSNLRVSVLNQHTPITLIL